MRRNHASRLQRIAFDNAQVRRIQAADAQPDGAAHAVVDAAATQIAGKRGANLVIGGVANAIQQALGRDDHAGRAKAALSRLLLQESLLQRMQRVSRSQAFDGRDLQAGDMTDRQLAAGDVNAIDQHFTGAAALCAAAVFCAFQAQVVAQRIEQRRLRADIELARFAVDL